MAPEMADRVVVITGTSRGIGHATALAFLREEATVVGCSPSPESEDLSLLQAAGAYHHQRCDVSIPERVEELMTWTAQQFGRLDCLVNNAGYHPPTEPIDSFTAADFREVLATNLVGPFVACKAALPWLRKTRGSIVNVGSTV